MRTTGPAPTDPFRLLAHLEDDHEAEGDALAVLDSDTLRRVHQVSHDAGDADHVHEEA